MKHRAILNAATFAAQTAAKVTDPDAPELAAIYDYARQRGFPSAEVLARKWGEQTGIAFGYRSLDAAPQDLQVFWFVFRAMIVALEPFREEAAENSSDDDMEEQADAATPTPKKKRK